MCRVVLYTSMGGYRGSMVSRRLRRTESALAVKEASKIADRNVMAIQRRESTCSAVTSCRRPLTVQVHF